MIRRRWWRRWDDQGTVAARNGLGKFVMGNCQAAEAAAIVIHHLNGRVEISHCSLTAKQVMSSNPGHYVAIVVTVQSNSKSKKLERYLKLLRPDDALLIGQVYRLVAFEDVLREFGSKRRVRLSKLLAKHKETNMGGRRGGENSHSLEDSLKMVEEEQQEEAMEDVTRTVANNEVNISINNIRMLKLGLWRPTLQTIAEFGN